MSDLHLILCSFSFAPFEHLRTNRLNEPIRKAGPVIGCTLDTTEAVLEKTLNNLSYNYPG